MYHVKKSTHLLEYLCMLGEYSIQKIILRIDNQGSIQIAKGSAINHGNKHIDMCYQLVCE